MGGRSLLVGAQSLLCVLLVGCAAPAPSPAPPQLVCGRVDPADCTAIEVLLIQQVPAAAHATTIAMDDSCQQGQACPIGLHVLVALLIPRDPTVDHSTWPPTYFAVNNDPTPSGNSTELRPWTQPLPARFINLLNSVGFGLPTPTPSPTLGLSQTRSATSASFGPRRGRTSGRPTRPRRVSCCGSRPRQSLRPAGPSHRGSRWAADTVSVCPTVRSRSPRTRFSALPPGRRQEQCPAGDEARTDDSSRVTIDERVR